MLCLESTRAAAMGSRPVRPLLVCDERQWGFPARPVAYNISDLCLSAMCVCVWCVSHVPCAHKHTHTHFSYWSIWFVFYYGGSRYLCKCIYAIIVWWNMCKNIMRSFYAGFGVFEVCHPIFFCLVLSRLQKKMHKMRACTNARLYRPG